jgi:hypothetical protein
VVGWRASTVEFRDLDEPHGGGAESRSVRRPLLLILAAALVVPGCSQGTNTPVATGNPVGADPIAHACALVRYWADTSGAVTDPDTGFTSKTEVLDIAAAAWPGDSSTGGQFVKLYDDLQSDMTDTEYATEASTFEATASCT